MNDLSITKNVLQEAKTFTINNQSDYLKISEFVKVIKKHKKNFDDKRKELKAPIILQAKQIEDLFREPINSLSQAEIECKSKIIHYQQTIEKKSEQELVNHLTKHTANNELMGENKPISEYQVTNVVPIPKAQGVSVADCWEGEVTDLNALLAAIVNNSAPLDLIAINESALKNLATRTKGVMVFPGLTFTNKKRVIVRGTDK